jgi:hypothetical protein
MPLSHRSATTINEADLLGLIESQEAEGKEIEYKRELPGKSDTDRKEFLYDLSSFANTVGGYLVFGMAEEKGLPVELAGLADLDPDGQIRRLEEMARDGLRPPIAGLQSTAVRLANGNVAIIIAIPKSWNPPHQVTYQKAFRFYGRDSNGKYQLDVEELRSVFKLSENVAEKMQRFRVDRIAKIVGNDTPTLDDGARMVTHLLPLSAFAGASAVDLRPLERDPNRIANVIGGFNHTRFNADGFVAWSGSSYLQMFRSGCLEAVHVFTQESKAFSGVSYLPSVGFESRLFRHIENGWKLSEYLYLRCPLAILVSFVGIKGWRMGVGPGYATSPLDVFDRDPLFISEIVVDRFKQPMTIEARPLIDATWNAAGWPGSPHYDQQGEWDPNR